MKQFDTLLNQLTRHTRVIAGLVMVTLFALNAAQLFNLPLVESMEGTLYDVRLRATMPATINSQIVIIDIDEKSLQQEGRWPWSRARLGELIRKLSDDYKVAVIGLDVVFAEAENQSGMKMLNRLLDDGTLTKNQKQAYLTKLQPILNGDRVFARDLQGRNVVMGYYFKQADNLEADKVSGLLPAAACDLAQAQAQGMKLQMATGYGANLPLLQQAAAGAGHFVPNLDADGVIRSLPLLMAFQGKCYESLSLAVLRRVLEVPQINIQRGVERWSKYNLELSGLKIPVQADASAWVPYRGYQGSFNYVSAADVLEGRADRKQLEGVVALLGTTAAGLLDIRATPVGNPYAGVEVHANMIAGVLDGRVKKSLTTIAGVEIWLLLILGSILAVLLGRASPLRAMLIAAAAGLLYAVFNLMAWTTASVVLPLASPLLLIAVLFVLNMSYGFLAEERSKRKIRDTFGQYVAPEVVEELMNNTQAMESMEGSSRNMTVLFSDIRNFTTISEGMEPRQLMRMMNEYLTPMTSLIIDKDKYRGTIDKYIGDAIMAFWGAPLFDDRHAHHAVLAALEMQKIAGELSVKFQAQGWPEIRIGVGLNTGTMAVGNMGSSFRRAYTVLGDPVNLAARLEGLTKEYGVGILVSELTRDATPEIVYRELDRVRVKGKGQAVSIHEPLGLVGQVSEQQLASAAQFHRVLTHYRAQQWDAAEAVLLGLGREDAVLIDLYLKRIKEMRQHTHGVAWDGVTTFDSK